MYPNSEINVRKVRVFENHSNTVGRNILNSMCVSTRAAVVTYIYTRAISKGRSLNFYKHKRLFFYIVLKINIHIFFDIITTSFGSFLQALWQLLPAYQLYKTNVSLSPRHWGNYETRLSSHRSCWSTLWPNFVQLRKSIPK